MRGILRDISERKRAEENLAAYQSQLRSMALELTMTGESERRQIATALHDGIGQTLAITKLKLSSLRQQLTDDGSRRQLDDIRELIEDAIHDTRSLTFDLSPPVLYELGFEAAVEWLLDQMHERYGLVCEFADDGGPRMQDDEVRVLLFRGVRELLMNVVKHAQAIRVRVTIAHPDGSIEVSVEDDGCGFDTTKTTSAQRRHDGFGLFTIRERLDHLGGRMQITSSHDRGTCVTITVPMNARVALEGGVR
jgi:signal transduction histidine kinase